MRVATLERVIALLLVRRTTVIVLLGSLLAGVTAVSGYALLTRLLPDRIGSWDPATGYRLADPIGYWNGLGIYAAMGTLLAVGLVARSNSRIVRALAGAAPPILVTTMLFTFSRGAWLALGIGLLVAFAVDPRRLQYIAAALVLAPWSAVLLLVATRSDSLTTSTNARRLESALAGVQAAAVTHADDAQQALRRHTNVSFSTPFGYVDLHYRPAGFDTYAALRRNAIPIQLEPDLTVLVSPLRDIIRSRTAAGDHRQLPALEATLELARTAPRTRAREAD